MRSMHVLFSIVVFVGLLFAQDATSVPAQQNAIETLAGQQGFNRVELDTWLTIQYNSDLNNLSKTNAALTIAAFQSSNPPIPPAQHSAITPSAPTAASSIKANETTPITASILEAGMSKRFYLVDGNIISGNILEIVSGVCVIETPDGTLRIPSSDILEETASITKKDDTRYVGPVLKDNMQEIVIRSKYGDVVIDKKDIKEMDRFHGGKRVAWAEEKKTFYQVRPC